jgi:ABC-type multidrug transport system fused ATPase/permease subunit
LFHGTLRYNLDPEGVIPSMTIRELLIKAGLDDLLRRADSLELNFIVTEGGSNLSVGEKQLICICRAILRKNKVVILDEATASIDVVTEHKILKLISEAF